MPKKPVSSAKSPATKPAATDSTGAKVSATANVDANGNWTASSANLGGLKDGNITVKSDKVRAVLEFGKKLVPVLPDDAVSYDDASNNRALISGHSALIWNPPSAWAVARCKRF